MIYKQPSIYKIGGNNRQNFEDLEIEILNPSIILDASYTKAQSSEDFFELDFWAYIKFTSMVPEWNYNLLKIKNACIRNDINGFGFWSDGVGNSLNAVSQINIKKENDDAVVGIIKGSGISETNVIFTAENIFTHK